MRKLELMSQHLFHRFRKVDHPVGVMVLREVVETITLDLQQATHSTQDHQWGIQIIRGLPLAISSTLDLQPEILLIILDLPLANSGLNHPLVRQAEHIRPGGTVVRHQVPIIHLK